ncbi:Ankyrin repeats (3 copies) [compost metagenome]
MKSVENLVNSIVDKSVLKGKTYIYLISGTENSFTSGYYKIVENEVSYVSDVTVFLFEKYTNEIEMIMKGKGILCIKVEAGKLMEYSIVNDMNPELFDSDVFELIIYQRYDLEPVGEESKVTLRKSLKAEKIKKTLVFACYMNDMEGIRELVANASKSNLDKVLKYHGTALQFCCKHNNLEAFRLLAEKGANVGKRALAETPLEIAFRYSSDIVNYIHTEYADIYQKEVEKKGFGIALHCKDEALLNDILEMGCDVNCEKKPFPPLHNFADCNNVLGIQFLLDHGANIECRNQYKQSALHRAVSKGNAAAVEILLRYGADIQAKDDNGKTPLELARAREDKTIFNMME